MLIWVHRSGDCRVQDQADTGWDLVLFRLVLERGKDTLAMWKKKHKEKPHFVQTHPLRSHLDPRENFPSSWEKS